MRPIGSTLDDPGPVPERASVLSWAEFQLHPSPKRQDLHRDGRYALHCFPPDDNEDAFVVSGHALLVEDAGRHQQATAQFLSERRLETTPPGFEAQQLFEFYLERCLWTATSGHGDWNPRHTIWRAT